MRIKRIVALLYFICAIQVLYAQEIKTEVNLVELISRVAEAEEISFSYDAEVLSLIDASLSTGLDLDKFISEIESRFPLKVTQVDSNYYAISPIPTHYQFVAIDSSNNASLPIESLVFALNGTTVPIEILGQSADIVITPSVNDTLVAYVFGYDKLIIPYRQLMNYKQITIPFVSPTIRLSELVIEDYLTKGIDMNPMDQSIKIKTSDLPLLPGETDGDIFASLASLPGLTTPDNRAGNLYIRGSDTDQSLVLYDNIPIYHRGHYYGMISPYNPKMVDQVTVYRSGFHPRLGDRLGGAVVIDSDQRSVEPAFGVGVNSLFAMAYAKVPFKKMGVSIGVRHSNPSQLQSPKLTQISKAVFSGSGLVDTEGNLAGTIDVTFADYNANFYFQPNANNKITLSSLYTNTKLGLILKEKVDGTPTIPESNSFSNLGGNLSWQHILNNRWTNELSITYSQYNYEYLILVSEVNNRPDFFSVNEITDVSIREEIFGSINVKVQIQGGIDFKNQAVLTQYRNVDNGGIPYNINNTDRSYTLSPYVNLEIALSDRLMTQIGLRTSYYQLLDQVNFSPRISLNYLANEWMTLKGTTGIYQQYLSHIKHLDFGSGGLDSELWTLSSSATGDALNGTQSMLGAIFHNQRWVLDIEGYFKTANNILLYERQRFKEGSNLQTYDEKLYGIDFFLKTDLSDDLSLWANYSRNGSSLVIDSAKDISYEAKYVQPNVFGIGGTYIKKNWKVSGSYKVSSGLNAQSIDIVFVKNTFDANTGTRPPGAPNPFDGRPERYAAVSSLDLSCSYKIPQTEERRWSASFGLSLLNVLNKKNLVDQVFRNGRPPGFADRYSIGFAPNLMLMFEF